MWSYSTPHLLPEMRGKLATWLDERGTDFYLDSLIAGSREIRPPGPLPGSAARLAADERHRVTDGELYWVSREMTELARHAGRQLSRYELFEHDLPSRSGFMVFETPLTGPSRGGRRGSCATILDSSGRTLTCVGRVERTVRRPGSMQTPGREERECRPSDACRAGVKTSAAPPCRGGGGGLTVHSTVL